MNNIVLDSPEQISDFFHDIEEDFAAIDYTPQLINEFDEMAYLHETYFANQSGPDGMPWAPISKVWARHKGFDRILVWKDALQESLATAGDAAESVREIVQMANSDVAVFSTNIPYSHFHDPPDGEVLRSGLPIRRHIGLTLAYVDQATDRVVDYSLAQLAKGA